MTERVVLDLAYVADLRRRGFTIRQIADVLIVDEGVIRRALDKRYADAQRKRDSNWQADHRRPGVTVTFATEDEKERITIARNGPGGPLANLLALVDAVPRKFLVVTISTPRTIANDLAGTTRSVGPEAQFLSRIERIGRLHPSRWPRWREDRERYRAAARDPLGRGTGRWRARKDRK